MGSYTNLIDARLKETQKSSYAREAYQSFFTSPEWMNVDLSEDFSKLLDENVSMFQFPYFRQNFALWRVFFNALYYSSKESGFWNTITSDYMVMDSFVVLFTSFELVSKGMISLLLYPFLSKENDTEMQRYLADYHKSYVEKLGTVAFYLHDYQAVIDDLSEKWSKCKDWTWTDYFSWSMIWFDLQAKRLISSCLQGAYDEDPGTTPVIVKYNAMGITDKEAAMASFKQNIADIEHVKVDDAAIYVKDKKQDKPYSSVYAKIEVPRYAAFTDVLHALSDKGFVVKKIAGQENVMVKYDVKANAAGMKEIMSNPYVTPLYEYGDGRDPLKHYCFFKVPTYKLAEQVELVDDVIAESAKEHDIKLIHNF